MPTYDYVCDACEHAFEEFQSITAKPLKKCPQCAKPKLRRLIGTGAGILFKGGGFYETDYRSDGYKKAAKADAATSSSSPSASSDKKESKAADAKPAATKAESKPSKPTKAVSPAKSD
jgi:putative FmdB family regulatory protein